MRRQLGDAVRQVWTEPGRVLFRLADGTTGDVEVNWDVGTAGLSGQESEKSSVRKKGIPPLALYDLSTEQQRDESAHGRDTTT